MRRLEKDRKGVSVCVWGGGMTEEDEKTHKEEKLREVKT